MKKLLLTVLSAVLMLGMIFALASCGDDPVTPPDNDNDNTTPGDNTTAPTTVYIVKDGVTDYSLAYSADIHEEYADALYYTILDFGCDMDLYEYDENTAQKEIVIGDTDRQISVDLKAAAEALKTADNDLVWAYGYKDGKLGFYANSKEALAIAWTDFTDAIIKTASVECSEDLWVTGLKTYEQYQQDILDAQNKEDAAVIAQLKRALAAFSNRQFDDIAEFPNTYGRPTIRPISSHPRIWTNSDRLADIKANLLTAENKAVFEAIKADADEALEKNGKLPAGDGNFSDAAMVDIENLAFMYLVTGREKYGYAAMLHAFNNMTTYNIFPSLSSNDSNAYSNSLNGGTGIYVMAEVYDWCYDLFTEEQRTVFVKAACEKFAAHLEMGYPPTKQSGVTGHGTGTQFIRNWLAFALAIADEYPQIYNFVVGRLQAEYAAAPEEYYQSGMNFHGSPYGAGKTEVSMQGQILFEIATGEKLFENVDFIPVVHSYLHRLRPDDTMTRVGDDYAYRGSSYEMKNYKWLAFYTATYYNDSLAKTWYKHWSGNYRYAQFTSRDLDATAPLFILLNNTDTQVQADRYENLLLSYYTEYPLSSLTARSAWNDANAWMTFTNICETYLGNHQHMDAGTFQIYYKGILAPDTGAYQYGYDQDYGTPYDYAYVKQTISKNGLLIFNPSKSDSGSWKYSGGQSITALKTPLTYEEWVNSQGYNQSAILGEASALSGGELVYAYISGDITRAYDLETVDLVTRTTMTLATGDEAHPMAFIVYDRIVSDNSSFEKSVVLHVMNKPQFSGSITEADITSSVSGKKNWKGFTKVTGTNTFYYDNTLGPAGAYTADDPNDQYNGQLTVQTLIPEDPTYYYVGGDGKRFWIDGRNVSRSEYMSDPKFANAEIGWGRIEITPTEQKKDDSFLNVMYVGDAGDTVTEQAQLVSGSATHEGVVTYGNCVMFAKSSTAVSYSKDATEAERDAAVQSTLVSGAVSFDTTGKAQGDLNYYVTGLAEGTWTVSVGGVTKTVTVTAEGAIAIFEAPAGQVTMTKAQ